MSCESRKWTCDYCTFENWPSSLKCTMCRALKPHQLIAEAVTHQDIYKLQDDNSPPLISSSSNSNLASQNASYVVQDTGKSTGKWICPKCTYLNLSRSSHCTECLTPRLKSSPVTPRNLHEQLQPLHISVPEGTASSLEVARRGSPNSPEHVKENKESENDRSKALARSQLPKWTCAGCTYENWPKAVRCIMCSTTRSGVSLDKQDGSPDLEGSAQGHTSDLASEDDNRKGSGQRNNRFRAGGEHLDSPGDISPNNYDYERRIRQFQQRMRDTDWQWLNACRAVVDGDPNPVEAYLSSGGDPARQLSQNEIALLNRPSAFDVGHTLVHLAIRFHREDMLATLLSQIEGSGSGVKRVPSYVAPDLAADIRRHMSSTVRQRKGSFPCYFVTEITTFSLPAEVEDLSSTVQEQLFEELLDRDAQQQLECDPPVMNWSLEVTVRLGSRLYALWNRSAGDCLLDSAMQATWGVFDRDNTLRRALSDSLHQGGHVFYPRWKEYEATQAQLMEFSLEEEQWEEDWAGLLSLASQPGASLEQLHVFALAHILRRPIIVYGVKYVKSFRGEALGYARFEGVYLPLLWEPSFCWKSPLALGYTRGHFSALVPMEPYSSVQLGLGASAGANLGDADDLQVTFLPLMTHDRKQLPVHFLTQTEIGREEAILRQWLDVCVTEGGIFVAQQRLHKRPLLVAQMVEEWLNHYRRLAQMDVAPFTRPTPVQDYSSDGDSDDE